MKAYARPTNAAAPSVPSYFDSGLLLSCSVDLPVSMKDERWLFVNTSGLTSRTQWKVASIRRTWPRTQCQLNSEHASDQLLMHVLILEASSSAASGFLARSTSVACAAISFTCSPAGPASRRISTMLADSKNSMHATKFPYVPSAMSAYRSG